jgi:hypothetical protein
MVNYLPVSHHLILILVLLYNQYECNLLTLAYQKCYHPSLDLGNTHSHNLQIFFGKYFIENRYLHILSRITVTTLLLYDDTHLQLILLILQICEQCSCGGPLLTSLVVLRDS